jgi:PIN domain nuclease of toxin-antitoxin system
MIVLDTHVWIWWVHDDPHLSKNQRRYIEREENQLIGISAISCWEVAKLFEYKRLKLPVSLDTWFSQALNYPGIQIFELTPEIAIESTQLPGTFHNDPADQIIVATARINKCPLLSSDMKIRDYSYVKTI